MIILTIAGFIVSVFSCVYEGLTEFTCKRQVFNLLFTMGGFSLMIGLGIFGIYLSKGFVSLAFFTFLILIDNALFIAIVGIYIFHRRILGAGEAHLFTIKLLSDFENITERNKKIPKDFKGFIKGIDD